MGVIRVEHNENYTTMSNYHLRDNRLSLRAMGLMSRMLSLPEDWDYTVRGLAAICKEGRDAVRKALQELEAAGYLIRVQGRSDGGNFAANDYELHEKPEDRSPLTEKPSTVNPSTDLPTTDLPTTENPPEQNNESNKETKEHPPYTPPKGAGADYVPKKEASWKPERFAAFWEYYPLHKSKQAAMRAWDKLKPSDELIAVIGKALRRQKAETPADEWKLHASTYLNQARWTDEPDPATTPRSRPPSAGGLDAGYEQW